MITFAEFQWAAFLYWTVSYAGNIGGDADYIPLMTKFEFLERFRNHQEDVSVGEIRAYVIDFLNRWKCRIKDDDDTTAKSVKKLLLVFSDKITYWGNAKLLDLNSFNDSTKNDIATLYDEFVNIKYFGPTATSKILHLLNPELFVMWDAKILEHYKDEDPKIDKSGKGYVAFLSKMSQIGLDVTKDFQKYYHESKPEALLCAKLGYELQKSLAKFIDEYNWITITKGIAVPPRWWPQ